LLDGAIREDQIRGVILLFWEAAMANKQTRRSISVRGSTYDALRVYCDQQGKSMSEIVEAELERVLGATSAPSVKPAPVKPAKSDRTRTVSAPRSMANKIVRAPAPPVPPKSNAAPGTGRPAPRPAREVIAERQPTKKGDYRSIQF
jgi:hypothetical protein